MPGETVRSEKSRPGGGSEALVVIEHKGEKHPQIVIVDEDASGKILDFHYLPAKARIEVQEGQEIAGRSHARASAA